MSVLTARKLGKIPRIRLVCWLAGGSDEAVAVDPAPICCSSGAYCNSDETDC